MRSLTKGIFLGSVLMALPACVTQSQKYLEPEPVAAAKTVYNGPKHPLVVGKFENRSSYGQGIFAQNTSKLTSQAKTILLTHLQTSKRFLVMDRANMEENEKEAKLSGVEQEIQGARILITGNVTEFGRRTVGDKQLWGVLGRGKTQVAYAKVMLNVVDVRNSTIIHSTEAAGEVEISDRQVIGFGGTAGYDSTLNGKVLNLVVRKAVDNLVKDLESKSWSIQS